MEVQKAVETATIQPQEPPMEDVEGCCRSTVSRSGHGYTSEGDWKDNRFICMRFTSDAEESTGTHCSAQHN